MSDCNSSSLVVADKNTHRPGGCVGIFFKLFDWNRRFAKKKLFPKKLLAPSHGKQVSKKLIANENLTKKKSLLTGDVNGGVCSKGKHEMRPPGLVAKLMGLESMPAVKPQSGSSKNAGFVEGLDKEVLALAKGGTRNVFQQRRGQKTGLFERRPVNRFGADALQIRNVLSRSRKRHPKLASPVKSPRGVAKSTSRLIDAATRILEPGLQATSRAKCALTYSNPMNRPIMNDVKAQTSCRNCGHALQGMELTSDAPASNAHKAFFDIVEERKPRQDTRCDRESDVVLLTSRCKPEALMDQGKAISGAHWSLHDSSTISRQRDVSPVIGFKDRAEVHSRPWMLIREDRVPHRSTLENMHNSRVSSTAAFNDKKDFLSTQRNMVTERTAAACRHVECSSSSSNIMEGSRPRFSGYSAYPTCVKSQRFVQGSTVAKSRSFCPTQMDYMRMDQSNFVNGDISQQRLVKESNHGEKSPSSLSGNEDVLGNILVQKLKELTSQVDNESTSVTPQGRTAAAILQELISALTIERPISPDLNDSLSSDAATTYRPSQANARGTRLPMRYSGNHFSPGSVLDASFSNDSCVSSSIDDCSGNMHHSDFMDLSLDTDLYDSSPSFNYRETGINVPVSYLLDHISRALDRTNLPDMKLPTTYSGYTKEVLFNAELLFGNADHTERFIDFLLGPFLFELETLAIAAWRNTITSGFQVSKGGSANPLRRFLFDCLVECLNTRYGRCIDSGFTAWCRLPNQLNMEVLIQVFDYEVRKWASLAEMSVEEIIEWEMSTSLVKWTDAEEEAFETGAEIGLIIFQGLVDETIADFLLSPES